MQGGEVMSTTSISDAYHLIHAGRYDQAHRLLLTLVASHAGDPHVWLLLGWTAPTRLSARAYFERLVSLQPGNPLALDGLAWSDAGWDALPGETHEPLHPPVYLPAVDRSSTPPPAVLALLALYLAGLALAESVTAFLHPQAGLAIHGALLVLLLLHAALRASGGMQKLLYCLALAPLIRLLSLSMPLALFQPVYWYAIIGLPLFLAALLAQRLTGYTPAEVGLSPGRLLPLQALAGLSGLGLGYLEYRILHPAPLAPAFNLGSVWLPALILLLFTGFLEELIFRGLLQRASQALLGSLGPLYVSLAFAVLHIGYRSLADFAFVFAAGLLFSQVAGRTRSIWGVTLAHGLTNIALFLIFPFILR
jgi:membrane protease YdiL (CAAX protease family)